MTATIQSAPAKTAASGEAPQVVDSPVVACDGGNGGLGHPRVFLTVGASGEATCPYCSRRFKLAEGAKGGHH